MENHPFDRIDPAANDIGVNKSIHDAIPYCPHCGKELVSEGTVGDRVFYKCPADGRKFKMPVDRNAYNEYRHELNSIYNLIKAPDAAWGETDKSYYFKRFNRLADYSFSDNDPQYRFLEIAIYTCNFRNPYKRGDFGSKQAMRTYKSVMKHMDDCFPLDMNGQIIFDDIQDWIDAGAPKSIPKWVKLAALGSAAAVVLTSVLLFFFMPRTVEKTVGDTQISITLDGDSYDAFERAGLSFEARELADGTSEYETASILLKNESEKYKIFDLSLLSGSHVVQPKAPVRIEMTIPEDYFTRNVSVYYISPEGKFETIDCEKIETGDKKVVVFYVEHFSLYAIAEHPFNIGFSMDGQEIPTQAVMWGKLAEEPVIRERRGYTFLGWFDGNEKWDFSKTVAHKDVVLEGRWQANEYTLTLDYGDGIYTNVTETITYDSQYSLEIPSRLGYVFLGWYTENSVMFPQSGAWKELSDVKLTARWELEGYKIRFDANGGSVSITEKDFTYGEKYGDLPTPTRPGFEFDGWYTDKNGGREIVSTTTITEAASHILYAHWNELSYTVSFNSNGGTSVPSQTHKYNEKVNRPGDITREGYEFLGWYRDAACTRSFDFSADVVTDNMTLYAKWGRGAISIAFDSNGGIAVDERRISQGDSLGSDMPIPTRVGYSFKGWYYEKSLTSSSRVYETTTFTKNTTLYAKWEANEYIIVYDPNGGAGSMVATHAIYDSEKNLPSVGFSRSGYDFLGWATSPDGAVVYKNCGAVKNLSSELGGIVTLYAKWDIKTYTISYVTNGGVISGQTTKYTVYDEYINVPDAVYPTYSEYNYFLGWYENEACTIPFGGDLKSNPRNITLYAKWDLCTVFGSMDETPLIVKGDNPLITSGQRIILDWSKEDNTNLAQHTNRYVDGTGRYDCIDIQNTVKEVIIIGSTNKSYNDVKIRLCDFRKGQKVVIRLDNFKFTSSDAVAIDVYNDHGCEVTINVVGICSITGKGGGSSAILLESNPLSITGEGELTVTGGYDNGRSKVTLDGSYGITSKSLNVDMNGKLTVIAGNGVTSAKPVNIFDFYFNPRNGGNGGIGIKTGACVIGGRVDCVVTGGDGGNGSDGGKPGYNGGHGGMAILCDTIEIKKDVVIHLKGGSGGQGGQGAKGAQGEQGYTGPSASANGGKDASDGGPGYQGKPGSDGGRGGDGACAISATRGFYNESEKVELVGGNGGRGGKGGQGGKGGTGGTGGADDYGVWFTSQAPGDGGDGGKGGTGGTGGRGGNNGTAYDALTRIDGLKATITDGTAGEGGAAGEGGVAGDEGAGGDAGANGKDGDPGDPGAPGDPGKPGSYGNTSFSGLVHGEINKIS